MFFPSSLVDNRLVQGIGGSMVLHILTIGSIFIARPKDQLIPLPLQVSFDIKSRVKDIPSVSSTATNKVAQPKKEKNSKSSSNTSKDKKNAGLVQPKKKSLGQKTKTKTKRTAIIVAKEQPVVVKKELHKMAAKKPKKAPAKKAVKKSIAKFKQTQKDKTKSPPKAKRVAKNKFKKAKVKTVASKGLPAKKIAKSKSPTNKNLNLTKKLSATALGIGPIAQKAAVEDRRLRSKEAAENLTEPSPLDSDPYKDSLDSIASISSASEEERERQNADPQEELELSKKALKSPPKNHQPETLSDIRQNFPAKGIRNVKDLNQYPGNQNPRYPSLARKRGHEGSLLLYYFVTPSGRVADLKLKKSSGHQSLDSEALRAVARFRFYPGQEGYTFHEVRFNLKGQAVTERGWRR